MNRQWLSFFHLSALSVFLLMGACSSEDQVDSQVAESAELTLADFNSLRWLEGTWRGSGGQQPFFERYSFINDSTIQIQYLSDSTLTEVSNEGSVNLSGSRVEHHLDGSVWVAEAIDSTTIRFEPYREAGNSFTWTKVSPEEWSATLHFAGGRTAEYMLTRIE